MTNLPFPFNKSQLGHAYGLEEVCSTINKHEHWTLRYKQLFKLANEIITLDDKWRLKKYLIEECESPVWLIHHYHLNTDKHYFMADSDSKIIRGLLVIILSSCNGKTSSQISMIKLQPLLEALNFGKYMTPSRSNGLLKVLEKIQYYSLLKLAI